MKNKLVEDKKTRLPKPAIELLIITVLSIIVFIISSHLDIFESIASFSRTHENYEIDEIISVAVFIAIALIVFTTRRKRGFEKSNELIKQKNKKLEEAIAEIKQLKGIVPICASCKMIRDDEGYWHEVEVYVKKHTNADFSHGLCPDCAKKLYPGTFREKL